MDDELKKTINLIDLELTKLNLVVIELNKNVLSLSLAVDEEYYTFKEEDYVILALRAISNYTKILLKRLSLAFDTPIEFIAISTRNLFECKLLVTYIVNNPIKAKDFICQKAYEDLEINEGFLSLIDEQTSSISIQHIKDRIFDINNVMEKANLVPQKYWTINSLAKWTGNTIEYKAFFKLYSKYVHPSSWLMNSSPNDYDNPVFRNIFLLQGQHNASYITKLIAKVLNH